jgi:hypothetical protein
MSSSFEIIFSKLRTDRSPATPNDSSVGFSSDTSFGKALKEMID